MSGGGTFETCRRTLKMSAKRADRKSLADGQNGAFTHLRHWAALKKVHDLT